jgi:molecular chaperone DnaK
MRYHKVIGIDLGTTYSAVSVWDYEKKEIVVIQSAVGENTLPSVVGLDDDLKVVVGRPAQQRRLFDPKNTIIEIKREMGVYSREPDPQRQDSGEPRRVRFRDRDYLPQEISAFILAELKRQAEKFLGEEVHDAVITVPAYFREPQRGATEDAAAIARLNVKQLLNEPTAAAVCFGKDEDDGRTHIYAVYDLGGGTFDVSIIEVGGGNVSIVGTGGDSRLGGGDFDDRIRDWALAEIKKKHGVDLQHDEAAKARIKQVAELRKRELSATNAAVIDLPFLTAQLSVNLPITRTVFNGLIEGLLQKSLKCMDEAIESAEKTKGVKKEDIEQVLLVGGSSRIPRVRALLAEYFPHLEEKDIRSDINPDEAVSRGSALVARKHNPSETFAGKEIDLVATGAITQADRDEAVSLVLQDVTSHTLGILVNEQDFHRIIPKESRIPIEMTEGGFVNGGPSRSVDVLIYQGENPIAFNNSLIGKLPIPLPEPKERGYWRFEVTFGLNSDGLLNVLVKRLNDNVSFPLKVQCSVRSGKSQLAESSEQLSQVMAGGEKPDEEQQCAPPPPQFPPKAEHATGPRASSAATPAAAASSQPAPGPPPAETPAEFRSIARRCYKMLEQPLDSAKRLRLQEAYSRFVAAVNNGGADLEKLGDALDDVYLELKAG